MSLGIITRAVAKTGAPLYQRQTDTLFHLKTLSQRRDAEDVTVTHSGHRDHKEVDAVPVG